MPRRNCHARELIELPVRFDGLKDILWGGGRERDTGGPGASSRAPAPVEVPGSGVGPGAPLGSPAGV
jgi:hypothetical protein